VKVIGLTVMAIVVMLVAAPSADAQDASRLEWTLVPLLGVAQRSPVGSQWGAAADRNHLFLSVQFETSVLRVGSARVLFAPQVTPFVRLSHTPSVGVTEPPQPTAYGAGFAPFGLSLQLPITKSLQIFGGGAVGGLWFNTPVPVADARAFNVTIEWGGGIDLPIGSRQRIRLGYRFHHLSNADSAVENPGVDGHVFYAGWHLRRSAPR
jgi:hypothetical protein